MSYVEVMEILEPLGWLLLAALSVYTVIFWSD